MSEDTEELQKSVDNTAAIESLREKVSELVEQQKARKESREAEKARRLEKSKEHEKTLEELEAKIETVAKQSGYDVQIGEEKENTRELSTAEKFFIPAKKRSKQYLSDWR